MAGPAPIVKQFVLCEQVTYVLDVGYWLLNPRADFLAEPGQEFPLAYQGLSVFIQLGGSYGRQEFRVRLVDVTDPTGVPAEVYTSRARAIDLGPATGPYRLRTRSWSQRLRVLPIPRPGRYELWLLFGDLVAARSGFLVEGES